MIGRLQASQSLVQRVQIQLYFWTLGDLLRDLVVDIAREPLLVA